MDKKKYIPISFKGAKMTVSNIKNVRFPNMPVVEFDYFPLMDISEKYIRENPHLSGREKIEEWERLRIYIEKDLRNRKERYNKLVFEYCEKELFPEIDLKIKEIQFEQKTNPKEKQKPELTINQIALRYVYEERQITRENGNKIAVENGHNSGEKLFQKFTYYSSAANRKGKPTSCTLKKLDNKIKLIESVIELLPTKKQERAKDEVSILKTIFDTEYQ